jgi:proteasome lid subunit RPN8/RPN11
VHDLSRFENARADSSHNRFLIEPRDLLRVQRAAAARGLDVIGFYHSHPDVAARPSQFDREHAWTWYSYVIVSVREGKPEEIASWVVPEESATFAAEAIEVLE